MMAAALLGGQDWTAQLDIDGWDWLNTSEAGTVVIFAQPARTPNSVWVRMEYRDSAGGFYSDRALQEVDCVQWRTRDTTLFAYEGRNLTGESMEAPTDGVWDYPIPGSIAEAVMIYHCGEN